jgi:hypothetical protein
MRIWGLTEEMNCKTDKLLDFVKSGKKIACYGAGQYGKELFSFFHDNGIRIDIFVKSEREANQREYFGVPLYAIAEVKNANEYTWFVAIASGHCEEIKKQLKNRDIRDFFCVDEGVISEIRQKLLSRNVSLKHMNIRERCFIMGTGPSLKQQDLKWLKNEDVFSTSWCMLIGNYNIIDPRYYVTPPAYGDCRGEEYVYEMNKYIDQNVNSNIIILDYFDKPYIDQLNLYQDKKRYYCIQETKWNQRRKKIYDLCQPSPTVQTATIMLLKVAMYMGYKEIYLIGTEHDLVNKKYDHAYSFESIDKKKYKKFYDMVTEANKDVNNLCCREILNCQLNMYNQYYYLHNIALKNGINIYNATEGGNLDEFPRIGYKSVFH